MNVHVDRTTLVLGECDVLSLTDAIGALVTVRAGSVWITQDLDTTDYIVRPGERFSISRSGRTVLQSFGEAEVSVVGASSRVPLPVGQGAACSGAPGMPGSPGDSARAVRHARIGSPP